MLLGWLLGREVETFWDEKARGGDRRSGGNWMEFWNALWRSWQAGDGRIRPAILMDLQFATCED